jgi:heme/copper-type cytochrome/quinol oxidase subunit 2
MSDISAMLLVFFDPRALIVLLPILTIGSFIYGLYLVSHAPANETAAQMEERKRSAYTCIGISSVIIVVAVYVGYKYYKKQKDGEMQKKLIDI